MRIAITAAAVIITGLAMYVSRGVLDTVASDSGPVRVALLPPWQTLLGFTMLAVIGLLWLSRRRPRITTGEPTAPRVSMVVLPALALGVLLLPFLPLLPDWLPALSLLAGPLRWIIWLVVGALLVWTCWQARLIKGDWPASLSLGQASVIVFLLTLIIAGTAAWRLAGTVIAPAGDEPHYLVIAQSLWRDGDLKIENNHERGDYREYFRRELDPHYLTRGSDGEIYSIHPVGVAVLMAPVYGLGGYYAVVAVLLLCAAAAATIMWRALARSTTPGAATFAWAAVVMTTPFLFNTFTVYPEIVAALAAVTAFTRATDERARPLTVIRWLLVGLACASLPWLSTKYAPMSAVIVAAAIARLWIDHGTWRLRRGDARPRMIASALVIAPYGLSLLLWFAFFYWIWGIPLPQAPYGAMVQTDLFNLVFGAPGLLFDQEYGLLPYAPVYILAATGLFVMWHEGGDARRRAIEVTLTFAALLGTVGAFRIWWGGSASPGRPVSSALLILALPIAFAARAAAAGSARRAAQHALLWTSVGIAGVLLFAQEGLLTSNGRDGTSSLIQYLSPQWEAWVLAPTFIHHEAPTAWLHSIAWLIAAGVAAVVLARLPVRSPGGAALAALATLSAALLAMSVIMPLLPDDPALPRVNLSARSRLAVLDEFDTIARPVALRYDPLRLVSPPALQTAASLEVAPGTRVDPQPVRVLHNGRFSLPAGHYRVSVEWHGAASPATIGLQVGRIGKPWIVWDVTPQAGATWEAEFALPMDAGFVGFLGSTDLERAIGRLRVQPLSVVDAARRPALPTVLGAMQVGDTAIFFHDENTYAETAGFWVRSESRGRVTFDRRSRERPIRLRIHSGPMVNRVDLSMVGWHHSLQIQPNSPLEVEIPELGRQVTTVEIASATGFRPVDLDPASKDVRVLGAWVELVPQ